MLRDREVFAESVWAVDGHGTRNPDQLAGFEIKDFGKFIVEDFVADFHDNGLRFGNRIRIYL